MENNNMISQSQIPQWMQHLQNIFTTTESMGCTLGQNIKRIFMYYEHFYSLGTSCHTVQCCVTPEG